MVTVHHLNYSRSTRILWCLEEIGQPYAVVSHLREPGFRAPNSLRAVHQSGKAPVLSDEGLVVAESGVILDYLDKRYGGRRFTPIDKTAWLEHAQWMYFADCGLGAGLMTTLYGRLSGGLGGTFEAIVTRETDVALARVEERLAAEVAAPYLFGDMLMLVDFQLVYVLELASYLGLLSAYPGILAYLMRLNARSALKRAVVAGGPMMPPPR